VKKMARKRKLHESACACNHDEDEHDHHHLKPPISPRGVNTEIVNINMLKVSCPSSFVTQEQSREGGEQVVFVDQSSDLHKIQDDKVQLAVWRQKSPPEFVKTLSDPSIAPEDLPAFEGIVLAKEGLVAQEMKKRLWVPYKLRSHEARKKALDERGIDQLVDHVEQLVQVFASIAQNSGLLGENEEQLPFVFVKLKVCEDNGCAFWHQDCVPFRMVTTFRGPCTEWVPPAFSTETLKCHKLDSKHTQSLSHCDVALFKGRGETDEDDEFLDQPGIVHRSPRIEGSSIYRLVLVIDIPQEGWHF